MINRTIPLLNIPSFMSYKYALFAKTFIEVQNNYVLTIPLVTTVSVRGEFIVVFMVKAFTLSS